MCSIVQWHFVLVFIIIKLWTMQWSQNIQQIVLNGAIHHQLTLNFFLCSQCYTMLSLEKNAPFAVNFVFSLIHYISLPKKTPTCFWPLVKMSHNNFLLYFVCIKAEVVFGHKIYEKLNFSQYLLSLATLHTQPMYQESFNTKILQIIDCFE